MTETPESTFADKVREISEKIKNIWNMMAQRIGEFIINLPKQCVHMRYLSELQLSFCLV